ncbi:trehalose-phosphatase [Candidatus Zixiibacteriota bacterium]
MLAKAPKHALLLDYDGTLAPFSVQPDRALPYPGVRRILNNILRQRQTRVVLISGRWTKDLIPLLGLKRLPEIWGSHGLERLHEDGRYEIYEFEEQALRGLAEADKWVESEEIEGRHEHKPGSLALHWRGLAPQVIAGIRKKVFKKWPLLAQKAGLIISEFDGGVELRVPGRNKGHAVDTILLEEGSTAAMAYLGDDVTDEDAFKAIKGKGLGVLVREEFRPTAADIWLKPPEELLEFLSRWHKTCRRSK